MLRHLARSTPAYSLPSFSNHVPRVFFRTYSWWNGEWWRTYDGMKDKNEWELNSKAGEWWRTYDGMKDKNEWELNSKATATMKHLLEQQPQKLKTADGEVLVYRVSPKFLATELSEISVPHPTRLNITWNFQPKEELLMIPTETRQLFETCADDLIPSPTPTRRLYVGTPGIGKSFSSAYLIRLLMENEVPFIMYETQKDTDRYAIALKNKEEPADGYNVFSVPGEVYVAGDVRQLHNPRSWYVVDCGGKKSPTPIHLSFCHQVCISSPDEENFDEWDKKMQSFIIPPPTLDEAHVMVSHYIDECRLFSSYAPFDNMDNANRLETLREEARRWARRRMMIGGPVLRRIMDHNTFQATCEAIADSPNTLTKTLSLLRGKGLSGITKSFKVENKPNSALFTVHPNQPNIRWTSPATELLCRLSTLFHVVAQGTGIEGGNVLEAAFKLVLLSGTELKLPARQLNPVGKGNSVKFIEDDQCSETTITLAKKKAVRAKDKKSFPESPDDYESSCSEWRRLPSCNTVEEVGDDFLFPCATFPLIDFMDKRNRGYNLTLSDSHSMKFIKFATGEGALSEEKQIEKYFDQQEWSKESPLHVIYVVPSVSDMSKPFRTTTPVPAFLTDRMKVFVARLNSNGLNNLFNRALKEQQGYRL